MNSRLTMIVCVVLMSVAFVLSLPAAQDESLFGPVVEVQEADTFNPQDPQAFLKWRQIKKLLRKACGSCTFRVSSAAPSAPKMPSSCTAGTADTRAKASTNRQMVCGIHSYEFVRH
uniref:Uncharacterized protein n=1 Tax=Anopheles dirus TaxID=7168 RepID=A0A182NNH3_9DIPT